MAESKSGKSRGAGDPKSGDSYRARRGDAGNPEAKASGPQSTKKEATAGKSKTAAANTKKSAKASAAAKGEGASSRGSRKPKLLTRIVRWLAILALIMAIIGTVGAIIFYERTELPDPNEDFTTQTTTLYYSDTRTELGRLSIQNRAVIDYEQMPQYIKDAVVAAEDRTFWTNAGIDVKGMTRALINIIRGQDIQGGSTITQQYIKIRYLTTDQTLTRKFRELALAVKMNQSDSKQDVLAGYLNTIYFGRGAYGVQAAAQAFYGVDAAQMNLSQAAVLASIVNSPSVLDPANGPQVQAQLLERYNYVLEGMLAMGTINDAEFQAAYDQLPQFAEVNTANTYGGPTGFLLRMATDELLAKGFSENQIQGGGLQIVTTFDAARQRAAEQAVAENVKKSVENAAPLRNPDGTIMRNAEGYPLKPDPAQLHVGLVSIDVKTGAIVALYGGADFVENSRNWATTPRYAASTFKVYGVVAGLRNGFGLNSTLRGSTYTPKGDGVPVQNDSGYNYGPMTLLSATQNSANTAFVDLIEQIPEGNDELIRAANDAGVPAHPSWAEQGNRLVLGEGEVTVLDNTVGFATIANQGMRMPTHVVAEVRDAHGNIVYRADRTGVQAIENDVARDTIHALNGSVAGSTVNAVGGRDVAGKTGTEGIAVGQDLGSGRRVEKQITRAAWLSGFTADLATSVLMVAGDDGNGNLDPYATPGSGAFYGAGYPTTIWNDYMRAAVQNTPKTAFPKPANIQPTVATSPIPAPVTVQPTPTETPEATPEPEPEPTPEPEPSTPPPAPASSAPPAQPSASTKAPQQTPQATRSGG